MKTSLLLTVLAATCFAADKPPTKYSAAIGITNAVEREYRSHWYSDTREPEYEFHYTEQVLGSTGKVSMKLVTNTVTETWVVTFTNLMLLTITTNSTGSFTNLIPVMITGTNLQSKWGNGQTNWPPLLFGIRGME